MVQKWALTNENKGFAAYISQSPYMAFIYKGGTEQCVKINWSFQSRSIVKKILASQSSKLMLVTLYCQRFKVNNLWNLKEKN